MSCVDWWGYFLTTLLVCVFRARALGNGHYVLWHTVVGDVNAVCFPTSPDKAAHSKYEN